MVTKCECLDCIKAKSFERFLHRPGMVGNFEDHAEGIFTGKILYANEDIETHSKTPDDFFPLTDNVRIFKQGRLLGSVVNIENVDGEIWIQTNIAGWLHYTPQRVVLKDTSGEPLSNEAKLHMTKAVLSTTPTGAGAAVQTAETISNISFDIVKQVIIGVIVLVIGAVIIKTVIE